jgi:hypothetical protein
MSVTCSRSSPSFTEAEGSLTCSQNVPISKICITFLNRLFFMMKVCSTINKVRIKLSQRLINWAPHHEDVYGSGNVALSFLTSAPDESELSASRPCRVTPGETAPGTHGIGRWVGPRAGLHAVEKRTLAPTGNRTPSPCSSSPQLNHYVEWVISKGRNILWIILTYGSETIISSLQDVF